MTAVAALLAALAVLVRTARAAPVASVATPPTVAAVHAGQAGVADAGIGTVGWPRVLAAGAGLAAGWAFLPGVWGPVGGLMAGAVLWRASAGWESAAVRARRVALEQDLPHVVDLMVALLAAGHPPDGALRRVAPVAEGPMRDELEVWCARLGLGADPPVVWRAMAEHPQLGRLGASLSRAAESGAPVREALERLAVDLRERLRSDVETRVRAVEVRTAVPLAVCLLPAFVLLAVVPLVAGTALRVMTG